MKTMHEDAPASPPPRDLASLAALDLNLLLLLDALLHDPHLTRAAAVVGLSQSAASHALARLRAHLGDPLLVRDRARLVPTPRAESLREPLARALEALALALSPPAAFDPATSRRRFVIAAADYAQLVALPPLVARLASEAPGIDLVARDIGAAPFSESLAAGDFDLAIGPPASVRTKTPAGATPGAIRERRLFTERFVCVVRAGHPRVGRRLDLDTFVALPHAFVAPRGTAGGIVDDVLAERGLSRRVSLMVQSFLVAPWAVASSDLVITLAERLARAFQSQVPAALRVLEPPLPLPRFTMSMLWHDRAHDDAGHRWLRKLLVDVCRAV